jgi:hypothetical protein
MTRFYLVANRVEGGGTFSPKVFEPFGIFDSIEVANDCILSLENFRDLGIIILNSHGFDNSEVQLSENEKKFQIHRLYYDIQVPVLTDLSLIYLVTSTSHVDMGAMHSFFPQFSLNIHGVIDTESKAQECIDNLGIVELNNSNYSSLPIITNTQVNPIVGEPIAKLAQHYDFNLLTHTFSKPYMLTVDFKYLDVIQTSVLEGIYPYFAYTNIDPSIPNIDEYAQNLIAKNRVQVLHNAAELIFTARNWNKEALKKYLFTKYDEADDLIYFHLIDYPEHKTEFDQNRMYMSQQLICNYINTQEKTQERLDKQSQEVILQMMVDLHPTRF